MALQPDFNAIARGISDLSDQVRLCANLPAVDHGARLFELLEELRTIVIDTREAVRRLEERVGPIETRLDTRFWFPVGASLRSSTDLVPTVI